MTTEKPGEVAQRYKTHLESLDIDEPMFILAKNIVINEVLENPTGIPSPLVLDIFRFAMAAMADENAEKLENLLTSFHKDLEQAVENG